MPIWPFKRKPAAEPAPEELRALLIAAASGRGAKLRALCMEHKGRVAANLDALARMPPEIARDPARAQDYVGRLLAVANCLAIECNAPELRDRICGKPEDSPMRKWDAWFEGLSGRMDRLDYDEPIAEARAFIEQVRSFNGSAARQYEAFFLGRLGELLFHSGRVDEALGPHREARALCRAEGDFEGEAAYLNNLMEANRYLGDGATAASIGDELAGVLKARGLDASRVEGQVRRIRAGEPLCRVVCARDGGEWELDEVPMPPEGHYQFRLVRNRPSLRKVQALVERGNAFASGGELAEALERYREAAEVDPHDPDPPYQAGTCLLELGAHAQARGSFEETDRLAPGWFRCRSDAWLAASLEDGSVTDEEFRLLRALEDGGLPPDEALTLAERAVEAHPGFAAFHAILGNLRRDRGDHEAAIRSYRAGLERAAEPDLESRILVNLAGILPDGSPERRELIDRAFGLEGGLVAKATARLLGAR